MPPPHLRIDFHSKLLTELAHCLLRKAAIEYSAIPPLAGPFVRELHSGAAALHKVSFEKPRLLHRVYCRAMPAQVVLRQLPSQYTVHFPHTDRSRSCRERRIPSDQRNEEGTNFTHRRACPFLPGQASKASLPSAVFSGEGTHERATRACMSGTQAFQRQDLACLLFGIFESTHQCSKVHFLPNHGESSFRYKIEHECKSSGDPGGGQRHLPHSG